VKSCVRRGRELQKVLRSRGVGKVCEGGVSRKGCTGVLVGFVSLLTTCHVTNLTLCSCSMLKAWR
jgi:hypothetical protein